MKKIITLTITIALLFVMTVHGSEKTDGTLAQNLQACIDSITIK